MLHLPGYEQVLLVLLSLSLSQTCSHAEKKKKQGKRLVWLLRVWAVLWQQVLYG